jgi:hypothetical protein
LILHKQQQSNRLKIYVNGELQVTDFSMDNLSFLDTNTWINVQYAKIGDYNGVINRNINYFDGYMAEVIL